MYLEHAATRANMEVAAKEAALALRREKNEKLRIAHFRKKFNEFNGELPPLHT